MVVMNLCHLVLVLEYDLDTKIFLSFIYMVQKQKQHNKKKKTSSNPVSIHSTNICISFLCIFPKQIKHTFDSSSFLT